MGGVVFLFPKSKPSLSNTRNSTKEVWGAQLRSPGVGRHGQRTGILSRVQRDPITLEIINKRSPRSVQQPDLRLCEMDQRADQVHIVKHLPLLLLVRMCMCVCVCLFKTWCGYHSLQCAMPR